MYVDKQATIGETIAWIFAVPSIVFAVFIGPYLPNILYKFEPMFKSLNAKLPGITIFMLDHGSWLLPIIPIIVSIAMVFGIVTVKSNWWKIIISVIGNKIIIAMVGTMVLSIVYPILELQKTLS
jgi:type II secretory pathway component PulF